MDAAATCRRDLIAHPGDCYLQINLVSALRLNGQTHAALNLATKVVESCDKDITALLELGNCLADLRQHPAAEEEYRRALLLDINDAAVNNNLGITLDKLDRYSEAEEHFRIAIRVAPDQADYHNNLGASLDLQERYPEAEAAFRKAVELDPKSSFYRTNLENARAKIA